MMPTFQVTTTGTKDLPPLTAMAPVEHHCKVCGKRAAFGYGVRLLHIKLGEWRCFEHRMNAGVA